jgi:hypothetical protein
VAGGPGIYKVYLGGTNVVWDEQTGAYLTMAKRANYLLCIGLIMYKKVTSAVKRGRIC